MNLFLGTIHKELRTKPDGKGGYDSKHERVRDEIKEIGPQEPHDSLDPSDTYVTPDGRVALIFGFYEASITITFRCGAEIETDFYAGVTGGDEKSHDIFYAAATREEVQAWLDRSP